VHFFGSYYKILQSDQKASAYMMIIIQLSGA